MTRVVVVARRPGLHPRRRPLRSAIAPLLAVVVVMVAVPAAGAKERTPTLSGAETTSTVPELRPDTTPLPASITGATGSKPTATASATGAIAKFVVGLGIVLAVIFGVYWLLKSVGKRRQGKGGIDDGTLSVVGSTTLGPGRMLHLIRVGEDIVLVGAAENSVTRVHAWTGADAKRLEASIGQTGAADGIAAARLLDELRRRTVRG
jgi:flagellar biogenesis protein FliO